MCEGPPEEASQLAALLNKRGHYINTHTWVCLLSWDVLVENFLDPSHVSFAHHGVQGNRWGLHILPWY